MLPQTNKNHNTECWPGEKLVHTADRALSPATELGASSEVAWEVAVG